MGKTVKGEQKKKFGKLVGEAEYKKIYKIQGEREKKFKWVREPFQVKTRFPIFV